MVKGRKPTTGRYDTVEELNQNVHYWYYQTNKSITEVAKFVKVSVGTVQRILRRKP